MLKSKLNIYTRLVLEVPNEDNNTCDIIRNEFFRTTCKCFRRSIFKAELVKGTMNPYVKIISDEQFEALQSIGALNERKVRNSAMRTKYRDLRKTNRQSVCMDLLMNEYPYLCWDSVRKIVYGLGCYKAEEL